MERLELCGSIPASKSRVWSLAWSHKADLLASCGEDRSIHLWSRASDGSWNSRCVLTGCHQRSIRHVSWSPCDRYLASASFDGIVMIWKLMRDDTSLDAEALASLEGHSSEVKCVVWSASGQLLASCGRDKSVWLWEFDDDEDARCASVLQPHSQDVKAVAWHPTEEILASCSYDNTINIYREELDDWTVAVQLNGHSSTVWKVEFSPDGHVLASCSDDKTIKLWTTVYKTDKFKGSNWVCLNTLAGFHTGTILDVSWSPDGKFLASCGADNRLCVFALPDSFEAPVMDPSKPSPEPPILWAHVPMAHPVDVNCVRWYPKRTNPKGVSSPQMMNMAELYTAGDDGLINMWHFPSSDSKRIEAKALAL